MWKLTRELQKGFIDALLDMINSVEQTPVPKIGGEDSPADPNPTENKEVLP